MKLLLLFNLLDNVLAIKLSLTLHIDMVWAFPRQRPHHFKKVKKGQFSSEQGRKKSVFIDIGIISTIHAIFASLSIFHV